MIDHSQRPSREQGNTLILSIVLSAVAIAVVLTFATITQMHIERKRLLSFADAAALHAATSLDEARYYTSPGAGVTLTNASVRAGVDDFIDRTPARQRERFALLHVGSPTGALTDETAQVTLSAFIRPGYIPWSVAPFEGFRIEVTAAARAD